MSAGWPERSRRIPGEYWRHYPHSDRRLSRPLSIELIQEFTFERVVQIASGPNFLKSVSDSGGFAFTAAICPRICAKRFARFTRTSSI